MPDDVKETACILSQSVKSDVRTEYCKTKTILIATYSMCKEGFDVPSLNTLVMATPRPDIDQIVGRILRVEKAGRAVHPLIVDIVDPQFKRQFGARNTLYKKRQYKVARMLMQLMPSASAGPPKESLAASASGSGEEDS